ncbi:MAG: hypothetical protein J6U54_10095 [Clostridiales bacterium]|nr:hypothetical protein [Clostridiales bacterium]
MKIDAKKILSIVSTAATITGLVAQLIGSIAGNKKQSIEISEAVKVELAKQLGSPIVFKEPGSK